MTLTDKAASFARTETEEGTVGQWMPIESAPKDGTWVLLAGGDIDYGWDGDKPPTVVSGQHVGECWHFAWYDGGYYGEYEDPTHWMPLPTPPIDAALGNAEVAR